MLTLLRKFRSITIKILASIFTISISLLFLIFKGLLLLPHPNCHLFYDFKYNILCCCGRDKVKLENTLHLVLNTALSLLSVLMILNYCQKMLSIVEEISHQTHLVFLSFVLPFVPQVAIYTPKWIGLVYLILSYVGITAQLSLTLDLIYLYNLPTIFMYKILALSYSKLLTSLKFCFQVFQYEHSRWLTVKYKLLMKTQKINKVISIGLILTLGQVLLIVAFYYLWLVLVIITLMLLINFIRNIIQIIRNLSSILLAIKGYNIVGREHKQNLSIFQNLRKIQIEWIPLIKLQNLKDVFLGKDIIRSTYHLATDSHSQSFSIIKVYESFTQFGFSNLIQ